MPRPLSEMPGPPSSGVLGNINDIRRDPLGFYERCAAEYGDLVRTRVLHLQTVQVGDPELIEEVLVKHNDKLVKPFDFRELRRILGDGLLTSEGKLWRRQRTLMQPSFRNDKIRQFGEIMVRRTAERLDGWKDGETIELSDEMQRITLEVVCEALFGVGIEERAPIVADALDHFMTQFEKLFTAAVPLPLWFPTPGNIRAYRAMRKLDAVLFEIVAEGRARNGGEDLLSRLLGATDDEGGMSDKQLRDELITMVLAGHETTGLALSWTGLLLAKNPDVVTKLQAELREVLGDRDATAADMRSLKYTRHIVDEAMRLYPPAWAIGREVKEPIELGGYLLPKKTQIFMMPWVTQRDGRFFEDPLAFRPERWDGPAPPKYAYFPFSGGARSCIGMHFAVMEAVLVLATVAQRFEFSLDEGHPIELQPAITLRPRHGIRVQLKKRPSSAADLAA